MQYSITQPQSIAVAPVTRPSFCTELRSPCLLGESGKVRSAEVAGFGVEIVEHRAGPALLFRVGVARTAPTKVVRLHGEIGATACLRLNLVCRCDTLNCVYFFLEGHRGVLGSALCTLPLLIKLVRVDLPRQAKVQLVNLISALLAWLIRSQFLQQANHP